MNSQVSFVNILFKNSKIFTTIIDVFCKNVEFVVKYAKVNRERKRLVGVMFILVSNLIQNSKIKFSKQVKEMIDEFLTAYISNSDETVNRLFIQREVYNKDNFEMTTTSFKFRKEEERNKMNFIDLALEQDVKDICFYNHVLSSYILIVAHLLISVDKELESKKQALKCLTFMFKDQIFEILSLCTTKRLTNTGEVLLEFTNMIEKLGDSGYINSGDGMIHAPFNVSSIDDLKITFEELLTNSTKTTESSDELKLVKNNNQHKFRNNIFAYGRSFVIDRNEFFYILKN